MNDSEIQLLKAQAIQYLLRRKRISVDTVELLASLSDKTVSLQSIYQKYNVKSIFQRILEMIGVK